GLAQPGIRLVRSGAGTLDEDRWIPGRRAAGPGLAIDRYRDARDEMGRARRLWAAAVIRYTLPGVDPWLESRAPPPLSAPRRAGSAASVTHLGRGGRGPSRPREQTPCPERNCWSSSQDRGPAGSWGHERLLGWRCPRALPLGSVRDPRAALASANSNRRGRRIHGSVLRDRLGRRPP